VGINNPPKRPWKKTNTRRETFVANAKLATDLALLEAVSKTQSTSLDSCQGGETETEGWQNLIFQMMAVAFAMIGSLGVNNPLRKSCIVELIGANSCQNLVRSTRKCL
jgi:hypothetical protein